MYNVKIVIFLVDQISHARIRLQIFMDPKYSIGIPKSKFFTCEYTLKFRSFSSNVLLINEWDRSSTLCNHVHLCSRRLYKPTLFTYLCLIINLINKIRLNILTHTFVFTATCFKWTSSSVTTVYNPEFEQCVIYFRRNGIPTVIHHPSVRSLIH